MAKFSVILPVYNNEKTIKACVESFLKQTHKNLEVICIDDGSTDTSLLLINDYAKEDDRVKILTQNKKGFAEAANRALGVASGEYIYFANPSDIVDSNIFMYTQMLFTLFNMDYLSFGSKAVKDEESPTLNIKEEQERLKLGRDGLYDATYEVLRDTNTEIFNKIYKASLIKSYNITFPVNSEAPETAFVWLYHFISKKVYFEESNLQYHKVYNNVQNKKYNYAVSYLTNWYFLCEQLSWMKDVIDKNYDNLVELLEQNTRIAKSLVPPAEKYKLEKLKQDYYSKLEILKFNIEREKERKKLLEFEQDREILPAEDDSNTTKDLKKTFFQKIYSLLPDPFREDAKILTIFGLEILIREKKKPE